MKTITRLTICLKNCVRKFKVQSNYQIGNACFAYNNLSNVFRIPASNYCTQIKEKYYKFRDINTKLLTETIPFIHNDEKLEKISSEIEFVVAKNKRFPENITADQLRSLCESETRTQRLEYLSFLFKKEMHKMNHAVKKSEKLKERALRKSDLMNVVTKNPMEYGLGKNSILLSVRSHAIKKMYKHRLAYAALFGEKIVLDLSYDPLMAEKEKSACVTQLALIYGTNRKNLYPYDLYFCNAISSYMCVQKFKKFIPKSLESFVTLTEMSYLDIFPKEKLVYLSPHAKETLQEYDHNAIYVIGMFFSLVSFLFQFFFCIKPRIKQISLIFLIPIQ